MESSRSSIRPAKMENILIVRWNSRITRNAFAPCHRATPRLDLIWRLRKRLLLAGECESPTTAHGFVGDALRAPGFCCAGRGQHLWTDFAAHRVTHRTALRPQAPQAPATTLRDNRTHAGYPWPAASRARNTHRTRIIGRFLHYWKFPVELRGESAGLSAHLNCRGGCRRRNKGTAENPCTAQMRAHSSTMHRRSECGVRRSARDGVGCWAEPDQDVAVQGPCASRVPARISLILCRTDQTVGERVVIKLGRALIRVRRKPIGDGRLLIDRERLRIIGKQRSLFDGDSRLAFVRVPYWDYTVGDASGCGVHPSSFWGVAPRC